MIKSGSLDRIITFEARTVTQDPAYGTSVVTWQPVASVPAQMQDYLRAESVDDGISMARRPCRIRIRWRGDITSDMRIDYDGRKMRIVSGPIELGRREGLQMVAEEISTEGDAP